MNKNNLGRYKLNNIFVIILTILIIIVVKLQAQTSLTYPVVDTGQKKFYNNIDEISAPASDEVFYGEDAWYNGNQPSYTDNGDSTITDNVTGLMWQKSPDLNGDGIINYDDKLTYSEAIEEAGTFKLAGYTDWRLPTIKELYSLIMFFGEDPSGYNGTSTDNLVPFINTEYFDFNYGDTNAGERIIDAQFATTSLYTGTTMMNNATMFGVNFADGRIKGYPYEQTQGPNGIKKFYVLYVRGNPGYGINKFANNGDGTITDSATGLMWSKDDSKNKLNWEEALGWVQQKNSDFNPATNISFTISGVGNTNYTSAMDVQLKIYDELGREVTTLVDEKKQPGNYKVTFDASHLASGTYFYRLTADNYSKTMKMICIK